MTDRLFGPSQLSLIRSTLESLAERQVYASYHFGEVNRILHENIDAHLGKKSLLELTLPLHTHDTWRTDNALTQASANAMACLQSLHCLLDTLAHAVCYALGFNTGASPLKERAISLPNVIAALKVKQEFGKLHDALLALKSNPTIKHLDALVNHSKHRRVLRPSLNVDLSKPDRQSYSLEFPAFSHNAEQFPSKQAVAFMEEAYAEISPEIVSCGNTLNEILSKLVEK
ncbi:MAG TPA: hypothetical protein PLS22_06490 [Aquabacterium sp.]|nr:hypothetical protein [Aquabacterium sp.]